IVCIVSCRFPNVQTGIFPGQMGHSSGNPTLCELAIIVPYLHNETSFHLMISGHHKESETQTNVIIVVFSNSAVY
ncbi:hypothetical protein, partial [Enterobacter asburiae]|uniref:hypothetical protein n=1 Tax=Enterobacter asburiae TaxID=61645 RepID=UPI001CC2897B